MENMEWDQRRRFLWDALRQRVLTNEELLEVASYGSNLNISSGVPFSPEEKGRELTNALLTQQLLRSAICS